MCKGKATVQHKQLEAATVVPRVGMGIMPFVVGKRATINQVSAVHLGLLLGVDKHA